MKILTFNHHESFLCSLARVGHEFDVVIRKGDLDLSWNVRSRPVPTNFNLVEFNNEIKRKLQAGYYDVVICHTIKNLLWLFPYSRTKYVFIAHIPLFIDTPMMRFKSWIKKTALRSFQFFRQTRFIAVSDFKYQSWGVPGAVIVLTPEEVPDLLDSRSDKVLIICNQLAERKEELGYDMIKDIQKEIPVMIVGKNPGVTGAVQPRDFQDFKQIIREAGIYLYTIQYPFGDGYNTAMLEAMKMGMAIVTIQNPSSPIIHGKNGLVGHDTQSLIKHLKFLQTNPDEIQRLGAAAKETVAERYSPELFVESWCRELDQLQESLQSSVSYKNRELQR